MFDERVCSLDLEIGMGSIETVEEHRVCPQTRTVMRWLT